MPIRLIRNRGNKDLGLSYQAYEVIQLAQQHGGSLSVADVVLATSLDDPTAECVLKDMIVRGYAEIQVTETGTLIYQFRDINVLALKVTEAITRHGMTCRLNRCEKMILRPSDEGETGETWIECHLVMTSNHKKEINFSTGKDMQLVDERGGFHEIKDFMAGNRPGHFSTHLYVKFFPKIPIQMLLRFKPVNGTLRSIGHIQFLTITYRICRVPEWLGKDVSIQFQHLPLSEKVLHE